MIEWKRVAAGDYVGSLEGRKVARVRKGHGQWTWSYRAPNMGTAKVGPPAKLLADAKSAVEALLLPCAEGEPVAVRSAEPHRDTRD